MADLERHLCLCISSLSGKEGIKYQYVNEALTLIICHVKEAWHLYNIVVKMTSVYMKISENIACRYQTAKAKIAWYNMWLKYVAAAGSVSARKASSLDMTAREENIYIYMATKLLWGASLVNSNVSIVMDVGIAKEKEERRWHIRKESIVKNKKMKSSRAAACTSVKNSLSIYMS